MLGDIKEDYGNLATMPVRGLFEQNFQTKAGIFNHTELPLVCVCVYIFMCSTCHRPRKKFPNQISFSISEYFSNNFNTIDIKHCWK
jgi:hypothetical protein